MRRSYLELAGIRVPLAEAVGGCDGPTVTVLAGVHGCEYASMAAVREFLRGLEPGSISGRLVAVPVLNIPAFRARTPFVVPEDGKNLNRCFPGDPAGTLAERLASATFRQLIEPSDFLLDLHAGDIVEALAPFTISGDCGASSPISAYSTIGHPVRAPALAASLHQVRVATQRPLRMVGAVGRRRRVGVGRATAGDRQHPARRAGRARGSHP